MISDKLKTALGVQPSSNTARRLLSLYDELLSSGELSPQEEAVFSQIARERGIATYQLLHDLSMSEHIELEDSDEETAELIQLRYDKARKDMLRRLLEVTMS